MAQAINYWRSEGVDGAQLNSLSTTLIRIGDLPGRFLGVASFSGGIWLDRNAAGHGWYVGVHDGVASHALGSQVDLLSALTHEMGQMLGLGHRDEHQVMSAYLSNGHRLVQTLGLSVY